MDQLYLVRHGIAVEPGTPGYEDDLRPLTPKGERRFRQSARGLRRLGLNVECILTSPLPRALRTAEILADELGLTSRLATSDALRADRDAASIAEWLTGRAESNLVLVGHNPAFSELVGLLAIGPSGADLCELRKGGVASLARSLDGRFQLEWLATPRMLRRVG